MGQFRFVVVVVVVGILLSLAYAAPPHVILVVADDLGYSDLGFLNAGHTYTPVIDSLAQQDGVFLPSSYAFTLCSPSRASLLSGRENWRIGWYQMFPKHQGGKETPEEARCLAKDYVLLPQMLKQAGYATHAIGKWDVGMISVNCTATQVGFDSFLGYYEASIASYWHYNTSKCGGSHDMSFATKGTPAQPVAADTYSSDLFASRATQVILKHNQSAPLFMYLAFQSVHMGDGNPIGGRQAPCETVDSAEHSPDDQTKVMTAMVSSLDSNVGRVVGALKQAGMWNNTVLVFLSDNGGKLGPSANAPFRGGKFTYFDGGLRVVNFVSGGALPKARRGTRWNELVHISDWLPTLVEGVAGGVVQNSGPVPVTGYNIWPSLMSGKPTPRPNIVFQVANNYNAGIAAMRQGSLKLIVGGNPGDSRVVSWPKNSTKASSFGATGGVRRGPHCYAPKGDTPKKGDVVCEPRCLFDVVQDPSESNNLGSDPAYASVIESMEAILAQQGRLAMAPYFIGGANATFEPFPTLWKSMCANARDTGFMQPGDWKRG